MTHAPKMSDAAALAKSISALLDRAEAAADIAADLGGDGRWTIDDDGTVTVAGDETDNVDGQPVRYSLAEPQEPEVGRHIALNDPATVKADLAVWRVIVELCRAHITGREGTAHTPETQQLAHTIMCRIAASWHPQRAEKRKWRWLSAYAARRTTPEARGSR